jgi:hypothetical protein
MPEYGTETDTDEDTDRPDWQARFPANVADAMRRYLDRFDKAARRCDFRRWTALNLQRYLA